MKKVVKKCLILKKLPKLDWQPGTGNVVNSFKRKSFSGVFKRGVVLFSLNNFSKIFFFIYFYLIVLLLADIC